MHQRYFAIYDRVAAVFLPLFPAANRGVAMRMVGESLTDPNGQFSKHAQDYELHEVLTIDTESALLVGDRPPAPQRVVWLQELVVKGE